MKATIFQSYFEGDSNPNVIAVCKASVDVRRGYLLTKQAAKVYAVEQNEIEKFISELEEYERVSSINKQRRG